jgi:hypothetical protein
MGPIKKWASSAYVEEKDEIKMALRLIEMVLKEKDSSEVSELLKEHKMLEFRHKRK